MLFQISTIIFATTGFAFISTIFFIIANIFFLLVGEKYLEKRDQINVSQYFILIGAINILWNTIQFWLTDFISFLSLDLEELYTYMLYVIYLPTFIVELLTFGAFLILIASNNEERDGRLLLFAGISSITHTIFGFLVTFLLYSSLSLGSYPNGVSLLIMGIANIISLIFLVVFNILLILYSFKLDELYLKISAFSLLLTTLITIGTMILSIF